MTTSSDQPFRFMVILTFEIKTGVLPPVAPVSNNYGMLLKYLMFSRVVILVHVIMPIILWRDWYQKRMPKVLFGCSELIMNGFMRAVAYRSHPSIEMFGQYVIII